MPRGNRGYQLQPRQPKRYAGSFWFIVWYEHGKRRIRSTGVPCNDASCVPEAAHKELARFIAGRVEAPDSPRHQDEITVSMCLALYAREHAPTVRAPERIAFAIERLDPVLGHRSVSEINAKACRDYAKTRTRAGASDGTIRRELGTLRAALRHCDQEGYLTSAPSVWLPQRPPARERWLTVPEVAALIRQFRSMPKARAHMPTFTLIAVLTGTRSAATLNLQWMPNTSGGWIDLERGVLYRAAVGAVQTKKRQTPCRLPTKLLAHLKRIRMRTDRYVIEYRGRPVKSVDTAFETACCALKWSDVTSHTLRHTAATWLAQGGAALWESAGYLGMSLQTFEATYGHHHPDFMYTAARAMDRRK